MSKSRFLKPRHSELTAADIKKILVAKNATAYQLGRMIGVGHTTIIQMMSGKKDGKLPLAIDLAIRLADYEPERWLAPDAREDQAPVRAWTPKRAARAQKRLDARAALAQAAETTEATDVTQ